MVVRDFSCYLSGPHPDRFPQVAYILYRSMKLHSALIIHLNTARVSSSTVSHAIFPSAGVAE